MKIFFISSSLIPNWRFSLADTQPDSIIILRGMSFIIFWYIRSFGNGCNAKTVAKLGVLFCWNWFSKGSKKHVFQGWYVDNYKLYNFRLSVQGFGCPYLKGFGINVKNVLKGLSCRKLISVLAQFTVPMDNFATFFDFFLFIFLFYCFSSSAFHKIYPHKGASNLWIHGCPSDNCISIKNNIQRFLGDSNPISVASNQ